jgi:hypothetical protein
MGTVHVVPLHDLADHDVPGGLGPVPWWHRWLRPRAWQAVEAVGPEPDLLCPCWPDTEMVPNDDGPDGWVVTHRSFDGREQYE